MFKGLIGNGSHINNNREREIENFQTKDKLNIKCFILLLQLKKITIMDVT